MNIRISKNQIRYRISQDELGQILLGKEIILEDVMTKITYLVRSEEINNDIDVKTELGKVTTLINKQALEDIAKCIPSIEGIEQSLTIDGNTIKIALEVDVRKNLPN
jgi:hypothetical protein